MTETTKLYPPWKELVKAAEGWEYGSFHSHKEIAEILGVEEQTSKYYGQVTKARNFLIEKRKLLDTHIDRGYEVVEVAQYDEKTFEEIKKGYKHHQLSVLMSQFAPRESMDSKTRDRHDLYLIKQVGLLNMMTPHYVEITKIISPIPTRFRIRENKPKQIGEAKNEND